MTTLAERLKAKKPVEQIVHVDGEKCLVRGVSRSMKSQMIEQCSNKKGIDWNKLESTLLAACVLDPETESPVFPNIDDWDLPAHISGPMVDAVMQVCGFSKDERDQAKNSETTAS